MIMRLLYALLLFFHPVVQSPVTSVVDGDTIDTEIGRVRLIGINAPERGQRCFQEAADFLAGMLDGDVRLERDIVDRDKYNRSLRYVHTDVNVQLEMVRNGYAKAYFLFPNYKYRDEVENAQAVAMNAGTGCLWQPSDNECIRISGVSREGDWVEVVNRCGQAAGLDGIYVESDGRQREEFRGELCAGCTDFRSLEVGSFVMLFDITGFIDYRGA